MATASGKDLDCRLVRLSDQRKYDHSVSTAIPAARFAYQVSAVYVQVVMAATPDLKDALDNRKKFSTFTNKEGMLFCALSARPSELCKDSWPRHKSCLDSSYQREPAASKCFLLMLSSH